MWRAMERVLLIRTGSLCYTVCLGYMALYRYLFSLYSPRPRYVQASLRSQWALVELRFLKTPASPSRKRDFALCFLPKRFGPTRSPR